MKSGVQILDISDPAAIKPVSTIPAYDEVSKVVVDGNLLYVADGDADFRVRRNQLNATLRSWAVWTYPMVPLIFLVQRGHGLYCTAQPGCLSGRYKTRRILSYSAITIRGPRWLALTRWITSFIWRMEMEDWLYWTLTNQEIPRWWACLRIRNARDVVVNDHYAYLADYTNGMHVIDIANPGDPVEAGSLFILGRAERILFNNHFCCSGLPGPGRDGCSKSGKSQTGWLLL